MGSLGYRFCPTEEELLQYLRQKVNGDPLPAHVFTECNLYGDNREPWNLFDESSQETLFVLTPLTPLTNKSKSNFNRVAGSGSWDSRAKTVKVKDLGFRRYYVFKVRNGTENHNQNGKWVMHEFSLPDVPSYVLCKIRNTNPVQESKSCGKKRPSELEVEGQPCKKKYTGSCSMSAVEDPVAASQFSDDGIGIEDLGGSTSYQDPIGCSSMPAVAASQFADDGMVNGDDGLLHQDPFFVPSSLILEPELFDSASEPPEVNESDYLNFLNLLLNEELPTEVTGSDDLNFWNNLVNEEPLMEENLSTCHGTNIQLPIPAHVF